MDDRGNEHNVVGVACIGFVIVIIVILMILVCLKNDKEPEKKIKDDSAVMPVIPPF